MCLHLCSVNTCDLGISSNFGHNNSQNLTDTEESPFLLSSHFGHNISQNLTITETEIRGVGHPSHSPTHTGNLSSTKIVAGRSPAKWQGYCPASQLGSGGRL